MLWVMVIIYLAQGRPHYPTMGTGTIPFISDIGATRFKPIFVIGATITAVFFFLSLLSVRHNRALPGYRERILDRLALLFGLLGCVSLTLLTVFDTARHHYHHRVFLLLYMLSIIISALFTTLEYYYLGRITRTHQDWNKYIAKASLLTLEGSFSVGFAICAALKRETAGAILEWIIAFVFTLYLITFYFDLRP